MFSWLTYIGHAAERLISKEDLASLGAEAHHLETLAEGEVLRFVNGVATKVDSEVAAFIANHPNFAGEFQHHTSDPTVTESTDPAQHQADSALPGSLTPTEQTAASPAPAAEAAGTEHPTA